MSKTIRKFEIKDKMGYGDVKATITIETDVLITNAELDLVLVDLTTDEPSTVLTLAMGPGFDHKEVKP